jgi:bifunctional DNase/RNase
VRPVDARPSDALALALRSDAPIWIDEAVLEKAGQDQPQPHKDEQGFVSIKPMELPEWTNALRHLKIPHD